MTTPEFRLRRVPIGRLCTLNWTSESWPADGIWRVYSHHKMGSAGEYMQLQLIGARNVKPGKIIRMLRSSVDLGSINVWRRDLRDPEFATSTEKQEK